MDEPAAWLLMMSVVALGGCSGSSEPVPATADRTDDGARLFQGNCIACHQPDARGIPGVYPSLAGSPVVLGDPGELARWVIKGQPPPSLAAGRYPTAMARFGWLKPDAAAALFTYLRSNFGNAAPPVDAATVAHAVDGL